MNFEVTAKDLGTSEIVNFWLFLLLNWGFQDMNTGSPIN